MTPKPDDETAREALRTIVRSINDHWRARRYDQIAGLLAEEVVLAAPGFGHRVTGREAYVKSYHDYDASAKTLEFSTGEPQIDLVGDTAVAVCPFDVTYEYGGTTYHERGHDILVFTRSSGTWKVAWRTMQSAPVKDEP